MKNIRNSIIILFLFINCNKNYISKNYIEYSCGTEFGFYKISLNETGKFSAYFRSISGNQLFIDLYLQDSLIDNCKKLIDSIINNMNNKTNIDIVYENVLDNSLANFIIYKNNKRFKIFIEFVNLNNNLEILLNKLDKILFGVISEKVLYLVNSKYDYYNDEMLKSESFDKRLISPPPPPPPKLKLNNEK